MEGWKSGRVEGWKIGYDLAVFPVFQSSNLPALVGHSRGALAKAVRDYEGDSLDYPMIRGLAAVLEARCSFGDGLHWLLPQPEDHKSKEDSTSLEIDLVCPRPSL